MPATGRRIEKKINPGYDIEDDAFAEGLAEAIENEDEETILEVCPTTYAKYPD